LKTEITIAFIVVVDDMVIGLTYTAELAVGVLPSVV
jgi:hypothetical protein